MDDLNQYISQALLFFRKICMLTLQEVSDISGISCGHISEFENNKGAISFKSIKRLSAVYDFPVSTIVGYAEKLKNGIKIDKVIKREIRDTIIEVIKK